MKTLNNLNEIKGVALIDFNATWCGPCRMLHPVLDKLEKEISDVEFFEVDVDDNSELAEKFNITNIPCVIIVKDGKEVSRSVGFKPETQIRQFINASK